MPRPLTTNSFTDSRRDITKFRKLTRYITGSRLNPGLIRFGALLIVAALPLLSSGTSIARLAGSLRTAGNAPAPGLNATQRGIAAKPGEAGATAAPALGASLSVPSPWALFQAAPSEDVGAFADDCVTPKTSFAVGETACVKVSGLPSEARRVYWIGPDGLIVQTDVVSDTSLTATRTISARGTWKLYLASGLDGTLRKAAFFSVSDAARQSVDLAVSNTIDRRISSFAAGGTLRYLVAVANNGPDAAEDVTLTVPTPNDTTYDSLVTDPAFPAFTCTQSGGASTCTIASLAAGSVAEFSFLYTVNSGVTNGTELINTATVASDTEELHEGNNSSTAVVVITGDVTDTECVLECPNDITVTANTEQNGQRGAIATFDAAEPFGTCGALSATPASGTFFPVGQNTVTVSSTEGSGGCSFTVTVIDTPAPAITCPPDKNAVAGTGELEASVEVGTPTTPETVLSVVGVRSDGLTRSLTDPYPIGTTIITWTARDQAPDPQTGLFPAFTRSVSCEQRVVVTSADAPTIACPSDKTFDAPAGACEMTLTEAQIGAPTTTPEAGVTVESQRDDRLPLTSPFPAGDTVITWTAVDTSGRRVSCSQTITVRGAGGTTGPVLNVPPDVEVLTDSCSALVDDELGVATATSACGGGVKITRAGIPTRTLFGKTIPTYIFPVGTTIITYTATDSAGNTATGTQRVVVKERSATPPTFTQVPPDLVLSTGPGATECGLVIGDATLGSAAAADNCPGVTVTRGGVPAGNLFPVGETTVTYTATDASGNTANAYQKVTVIDNTAPTVAAPADVTLYTGAGAASCSVTVSNLDAALGTASAQDNCPGVTVARGGGNVFPLGETIVTYTATDAHGNTATAQQKVTVVDNTPPVVVPPPDVTVYLPLNSTATSMPVTYPNPATATDNCAGAITFNYSPASGSVFPVGPTTVTVTATDAHNNSAQATFTVTVLYNFTGFFSPVVNPPTLNVVNAGRAIPVKFSLSGDKGLDIFAPNSPYTVAINCDGSSPQSDVTETLTAGSSTLSYTSSSDQYNYVWKTEGSWAGTCRQLVVKLNDGSTHTANFKFK